MTRALITVSEDETIETVMGVMADNSVSSVVVDPNAAGQWGILTRRDIVTKVVQGNKNPATAKVKDLASRPVVSVPAETTIRDAAAMLSAKNFSRLPISQGDRIIGIVTETDLFNAIKKFGWTAE
nr:CBS domain-containing protein [Hydrocarboniphaga daqingensis]